MQGQFLCYIAPLPRPDHLAVREAHRMQGAFDFGLPKRDKLEQTWMIRGQIVLLPYETVEHVLVVGHPVKKLRSG